MFISLFLSFLSLTHTHTHTHIQTDSNSCYIDDWGVITLIQGVCFKGLERYDEALQCFQAVIDR